MINKKRKFLSIFGFLSLFLITIAIYNASLPYWKNPIEYIELSDKDDMYLRVEKLSKIKTKKEFDRILITLIKSKDLFSVEVSGRYIYENTYCNLSSNLKEKYAELKQIPKDSIWEIQIADGRYREFNLNDNNSVMLLYPIWINTLDSICPSNP